MKIYIIRHGQTTGDVEDRYGGAYDDELSDKGEDQTRDLANKLANSGIQIIFSSPMVRAQQTAIILSKRLNCELKTIANLKERNKNGILSGMPRDEAKTKYPKLVEKLKDYRNQIQGAEPHEDFVKRIKKAFKDAISAANYSTVGIVTHGGPIWVIFKDILKEEGIIDISDCGYMVLNSEGQKLTLERLDGIKYKKK